MSIDVNLANYLFGEVKDHLLEKKGMINPPKDIVGAKPSKYSPSQKKKAAEWLKKGSVSELKKYREKMAGKGSDAKAMRKMIDKALANKPGSKKGGFVKRIISKFFGKKKVATKGKVARKSRTTDIIKQLEKNPDVRNPQALAGYIRHYVKTGLRKPGRKI